MMTIKEFRRCLDDIQIDEHRCGYFPLAEAIACVDAALRELETLRATVERCRARGHELNRKGVLICHWHLEDDELGLWHGSCGAEWHFPSGTPEDNEMHYCPHCGGVYFRGQGESTPKEALDGDGAAGEDSAC